MITLTQLKQIIPSNQEPEVWLDLLNKYLPKYGIDTVNRTAGFLAQCAHESGEFTKLFENLNYSAKRLTQVWPKRFPNITFANQYDHDPEKLANHVYANRMGNGDSSSGDGWKFRGKGIKQITGRYNYTEFGETVGLTADEAAKYLETKKGAVESACWFWKTNNLNKTADNDDVVSMTKIINGGTNGLDDRKIRYNRAKSILSSTSAPVSTNLKLGSKSNKVKEIQKKFGITPDGTIGPITESYIKTWQKAKGFDDNGILTESQLALLLK